MKLKRAFFCIAALVFLVGTVAMMFAQQQMGAVATPQINTDYYIGSAPGIYSTIQSAVTKACATAGARIVIPAAATPSDTIAGVTGGCTKVQIEDRRTAPSTSYMWSSTQYQAALPAAATAAGPAGTPTLCPAGQAAQGVGAGFAAAGCFTPSGGGGTPGGASLELQSNNSNTAFAGTNIFTSSDKTINKVGSMRWELLQQNSSQIGFCGGRQCANLEQYYADQPTIQGTTPGFGQDFYHYHTALFNGPNLNNGSPTTVDKAGGAVVKVDDYEIQFHTPAISQVISGNIFCAKLHDCAGFYFNMFNHGGAITPADEGITPIRINGGNLITHLFQGLVSGSPAVGATTVAFSPAVNLADVVPEGLAFDPSAPMAGPCNVAYNGYNGATNVVTVAPGCITASGVTGTTITTIVPTTFTANGSLATFTVHVDNDNTPGAAGFDGTDVIALRCPEPQLEFLKNYTVSAKDASGNQVITGLVYHGHASGCFVAQAAWGNGTVGTHGILDLVYDRNGSAWRTGYYVVGATDATHLTISTYAFGAQGTIIPWMHNFGTQQVTSLTRASNVVTACNLGNTPTDYGGELADITGAADSSFNATGVQLSNNNSSLCVTYANSGPNASTTGATITIGGTVGGANGSGAFYVWPAAMIRQADSTVTTDSNGVKTAVLSGTLEIYPNDMTWTNGHFFTAVDDMQSSVHVITALHQFETMPNLQSSSALFEARYAGHGVTSGSFRGYFDFNQNPYSLYEGGCNTTCTGANGRLTGPTVFLSAGPHSVGYHMDAPLPRGRVIDVGTNPAITSNFGSNTYFPFCFQANGGNCGFFATYDPNAGLTQIVGGTGHGTGGTIQVNDNLISISAGTGPMTLTANSYTFPHFAAAGTQCATFDTTGLLGEQLCSTLIPVFGASGTNHKTGIVPDPGATAGTTRYLREDATFADPLAGGVTVNGSSCTITAIVKGVITAATCTP